MSSLIPFDRLFTPDTALDPYPLYHRLRREDPVHWSEAFDAWVLTRYDDIVRVLHDPRFSSDRSRRMHELTGRDDFAAFFTFVSNRMVFTDPPKHTRLRTLLNKAFTPKAVEAMRLRIDRIVDRFLDPIERSGEFDLIADFAFPLPITVILEMMGLPPEDRVRIKAWADAIVVFFANHPGRVPAEAYAKAGRAVEEFADYLRQALAGRRNHPGDDLLSALQRAEESGDRLSEPELIANAHLLLSAGHETTTNLIGNGVLAFMRHPAQWQRVRDETALIPSAVEEMLRYDSSVQFTHRLATDDVVLGGKTIRRGQLVFLLLAAANRDPEQFADPDAFDAGRRPNKHIAFVEGAHYCLGAPLARLEGQVALAALLRRLPRLRFASEQVAYRPNFNLRGLTGLKLRSD